MAREMLAHLGKFGNLERHDFGVYRSGLPCAEERLADDNHEELYCKLMLYSC